MSLAASTDAYENTSISARLISVENGVAPNSGTLSLGLDIQLAEGWKAYWRSPGEVGLPPDVSWDGSENLASAQMLWPAPERFTAFGIENFGYKDRVVLPIQAVLETVGFWAFAAFLPIVLAGAFAALRVAGPIGEEAVMRAAAEEE